MLTVFLGGDVMTGRGVDQILAHPGDPRLWEVATRDAGTYVRLAEEASGPIARPVADDWPWGDALEALDRSGAQVRIANLETSITTHDEAAPGKGVHYRMAPRNVGCLTAARLDALALANNHVLDFGQPGLLETLDTLAAAGIATAGAGRDADEADRPAIVPVPGGRVVLFSLGSPSSGVPPEWRATVDRPGVRLFTEHSRGSVTQLVEQVAAWRRPRDLVVASVHWGSNWGYDVPSDHIDAARRLVDSGVDIVHGHSAHHPRPVEIYRGKLILYGVGDLIDDYEGIQGYEEYRPELRLLPLPTVEVSSGRLAALELVPMRTRQLSLRRADRDDVEFLCRTLNQISSAPPFVITDHGTLRLMATEVDV